MMPTKKHYSYTNLDDTPKHGEIIESSYLLAEKGPKSTWTRITEVVVLLATIGGCAYLLLFLFHSGNHHSEPTTPAPSRDPAALSASSSSTNTASSLCRDHVACMAGAKDRTGYCCPTEANKYLECCKDQ